MLLFIANEHGAQVGPRLLYSTYLQHDPTYLTLFYAHVGMMISLANERTEPGSNLALHHIYRDILPGPNIVCDEDTCVCLEDSSAFVRVFETLSWKFN